MGSADLGLILGNGEIENPYNLLATNSLHGFISGERDNFEPITTVFEVSGNH